MSRYCNNAVCGFDGAFAVSSSNTVDFTRQAEALLIGGAGTISLQPVHGSALTFFVPAGILDLKVLRVNETGTSATSITALY